MKLRDRLFLGFAGAVGLALPVAVGIEYDMTRQMYRESMLERSGFVAELLEEKVVEPLDEREKLAEKGGVKGHWEAARLDLETDHATAWVSSNGRREEVPLKAMLSRLQEVPVIRQGYSFLLDTHGRYLVCPGDGQVLPIQLKPEWTEEAFSVVDRGSLRITDPFKHLPSDIVILVVPRVGLAVGVVFPEKAIQEQLEPLARAAAQMTLVLLLVAWVLCYLLARRVTAPLEELTQAVRRTVKGELDVPLLPSGITEVGQLSAAFSKMRDDLSEYLRQIASDASEKARVARELELARSIQKIEDLEVESGGWVASARSEPAREVGGDFMDLLVLDDGRLAMLIGDVSGKGIPAALYTILSRAALRLGLASTLSPARALQQANDLLIVSNMDSNFVTALVAVFCPRTRELTWARAGHPVPLGVEGPLTGPNGPPLGLVEGFRFQETTSLLQGSAYLLYTDGFPEAENAQGEFLRVGPMLKELASPAGDLWGLLARHRGECESNDDSTAILLRPKS